MDDGKVLDILLLVAVLADALLDVVVDTLLVTVLDDALLLAVLDDALLVAVLVTEVSTEIELDGGADEGKEVPQDCPTVDEVGFVTYSTLQLPFDKHVYTVVPLPPSYACVAWSPADTVLLPQVLFRLALA